MQQMTKPNLDFGQFKNTLQNACVHVCGSVTPSFEEYTRPKL